MVRTLGIVIDSATGDRAEAHLPDDERWHNHIGGPHAGAMFTLGESTSGALVLAAVGDLLPVATPLATSASIDYVARAHGEVRAVAVADPVELAAARAAVRDQGRPDFTVSVELTAGQRTTARMTIAWTLYLHR
jgi:uncharacterized protein (TIGR00369 family)